MRKVPYPTAEPSLGNPVLPRSFEARPHPPPRFGFPGLRSGFWRPAGEEMPQSQALKGPRGPRLHPPLFPQLPSPPPLHRFPSPSQRASEEPGASALSPAPIEKWVLVTTQITAFPALLPTARCKGPPKGGGPACTKQCRKASAREAGIAQSSP